MMKILDLSRSLLILPSKYGDVRPHHLALCYGLVRAVMATSLYRTIANSIVKLLSISSDSFLPLVHYGLVPDFLIRFGIRLKLRDHLNILRKDSVELELQQKLAIIKELTTMPIAIETNAANQQHYEVPAKFYDLCLGPQKKYSCGWWESYKTTFEESELAMLAKYCQLANVRDGMKIVDLGCGWGSLTLYLAEKYPQAKITAISNSNSQREYIYATAQKRGYNVQNINVITCNVSDDKGALDAVKDNDLVMTVEM